MEQELFYENSVINSLKVILIQFIKSNINSEMEKSRMTMFEIISCLMPVEEENLDVIIKYAMNYDNLITKVS